MKVLRKNDEFRRMPEKGVADAKAIQSLISMGWNYSPKQAMKDYFKTAEKPAPKVKEEEVVKKEKNTNKVEKYGKKKVSRK